MNQVKIEENYYTIGGAVAAQKEAGWPSQEKYFHYHGLAGIYSEMVCSETEKHLCLLEDHHQKVLKGILPVYGEILPKAVIQHCHRNEDLIREHLKHHQLGFFKYRVIQNIF